MDAKRKTKASTSHSQHGTNRTRLDSSVRETREEETMTARAFLRLSEGLREAFASAQDDETLRYLRVEVVDGDRLEAVGSKQKGDLETDFDALAQASGRQECKTVMVVCGFAPCYCCP